MGRSAAGLCQQSEACKARPCLAATRRQVGHSKAYEPRCNVLGAQVTAALVRHSKARKTWQHLCAARKRVQRSRACNAQTNLVSQPMPVRHDKQHEPQPSLCAATRRARLARASSTRRLAHIHNARRRAKNRSAPTHVGAPPFKPVQFTAITRAPCGPTRTRGCNSPNPGWIS